MGLDIYFFKKSNGNGKYNYTEIGYFRKVNFLVRFMENYGKVENCRDLKLTKEIVTDLYDRCGELILYRAKCGSGDNFDQSLFSKKAHELLPTCEGFFFGSAEYDEWYYNDVKDVKKSMRKILNEFDKLKEGEEIVFHIWY